MINDINENGEMANLIDQVEILPEYKMKGMEVLDKIGASLKNAVR